MLDFFIPFFLLWLSGLIAILLFQVALWLTSLLLRDSSIVDIFWGPLFLLASLVYAWQGDGFAPRSRLLLVLIAIWGLRLGGHILLRNWGHGEDFRYRTWREQHGAAYWWVSFFQVYLLQGLLAWLISVPLVAVHLSPTPDHWHWLDGLGLLLWSVGFFFEAVGDWQLRRFKANPAHRGQVMDRGLWRYTRHPNYFGDALLWWGIGLFALATTGGWWTLLGPAIMTWLLLRVSGVAMLERTLVETRPAYRDYIARTSSFLPWPPRVIE